MRFLVNEIKMFTKNHKQNTFIFNKFKPISPFKPHLMPS